MSLFKAAVLAALALLAAPARLNAQPEKPAKAPAAQGDIPAKFARPTAGDDYVRRVEMIPMRDASKTDDVTDAWDTIDW